MISTARIWRPLAGTLLAMLMVVTLSLESVHLRQSAALRLLTAQRQQQSPLPAPDAVPQPSARAPSVPDPTRDAALAARVLRLQNLSQGLIFAALLLGAALICGALLVRSRRGAATASGDPVAAGMALPPDVATLSRQLQHVNEKEKAQLARSLHDELGGLLIAVKMDSSWLQKRWPQPTADVQSRWERVFKVLDDGVDYKRRVVEQLRPTLLDNMGLIAALRWVAQDLCSRAGLSVAENYPEEEPLLSDEVSILVFRLVQEALTNIVRHAQATDVHIDISNEAPWLSVLVEDNGVGIGERGPSATLHGLAIMELRVRSLGGTFEVERLAGGGTLLRARLPSQGTAAAPAAVADNNTGNKSARHAPVL